MLGRYGVALGLLGLGQGSALWSLLLISGNLSPDGFGQLSSGLAIQNYIVILGTLGLRTLATRDLARAPGRLGRIWGTLWGLTTPAGIALAIGGHLVGGALFARSADEIWMSLWLSCGTCFSILSVVPLLDALGRQSLALGGVALAETLFAIALLTGWIPMDVASLGAGFAIKWTVASLLQAISLRVISGPVRPTFSRRQLNQWKGSAAPLLLTALIMNVPFSGAVVLTRHLLGAADSAVMGFAAQLAAAILLLGGVAVRFLQPIWRDAAAIRETRSRKLLTQVGLYAFLLWMAIVLIVTVIVSFWLPDEYLRGMASIQLMLLAAAISVLARVLWVALEATHQERRVLIAYSTGSAAFIVTSIGCAHPLGSTGVALAAVFGMAATVLMMWGHLSSLFKR
ncbi:lipopolysaccharide biosynthesis protein [Rubinisphaera margarita]|uniref:lipopolysaccharide biosynthesis protein n=1 Tax=Rubinisphaera margarita TaxID=2909586 RepID=UPI001EE8FC2A|nr:hypothetical protein [Rubinisphaera margarita]MCG6154844.1 hypothetical protein [Rubinisphaera margarita]